MTNLSAPFYKRFDEKGNFILDEVYLMAFWHHDGLSERLLSIDLLLDKQLELSLYLHFLKPGGHPTSPQDVFRFHQVFEKVPLPILQYVQEDLRGKTSRLKDHYDLPDSLVDDSPQQVYLFNNDGKTKMVQINGLSALTENHFTSDEEKAFLRFHTFVKSWTNALYENYAEGNPFAG